LNLYQRVTHMESTNDYQAKQNLTDQKPQNKTKNEKQNNTLGASNTPLEWKDLKELLDLCNLQNVHPNVFTTAPYNKKTNRMLPIKNTIRAHIVEKLLEKFCLNSLIGPEVTTEDLEKYKNYITQQKKLDEVIGELANDIKNAPKDKDTTKLNTYLDNLNKLKEKNDPNVQITVTNNEFSNCKKIFKTEAAQAYNRIKSNYTFITSLQIFDLGNFYLVKEKIKELSGIKNTINKLMPDMKTMSTNFLQKKIDQLNTFSTMIDYTLKYYQGEKLSFKDNIKDNSTIQPPQICLIVPAQMETFVNTKINNFNNQQNNDVYSHYRDLYYKLGKQWIDEQKKDENIDQSEFEKIKKNLKEKFNEGLNRYINEQHKEEANFANNIINAINVMNIFKGKGKGITSNEIKGHLDDFLKKTPEDKVPAKVFSSPEQKEKNNINKTSTSDTKHNNAQKNQQKKLDLDNVKKKLDFNEQDFNSNEAQNEVKKTDEIANKIVNSPKK